MTATRVGVGGRDGSCRRVLISTRYGTAQSSLTFAGVPSRRRCEVARSRKTERGSEEVSEDKKNVTTDEDQPSVPEKATSGGRRFL